MTTLDTIHAKIQEFNGEPCQDLGGPFAKFKSNKDAIAFYVWAINTHDIDCSGVYSLDDGFAVGLLRS